MSGDEQMQKLEPPPRYGDLKELSALLEAAIPTLTQQIARLLGKKTPRSTRRDRRILQSKMDKFLANCRPYLLGLYGMQHPDEKQKCVYALLEGVAREQLRMLGTKIADTEDGFAIWLRLCEQAAGSQDKAWAKVPSYIATKTAISNFAESLQQRLDPTKIQDLLEEWGKSASFKRYVHCCNIWPTLMRRSRQTRPERLTFKLALQLSEEYKAAASLLEERLRLVAWLDDAAQGKNGAWADQEKRNLSELLEAAALIPSVASITTFIDRHVRNALAHGQPELILDLSECNFHDRGVTVTWKVNEFFEKTKDLSFAAYALLEFDLVLRLVQTRSLVAELWQRAKAESSRQIPASTHPRHPIQEYWVMLRQAIDKLGIRARLPKYINPATEQAGAIAHFLNRALQLSEAALRIGDLATPLHVLTRILCDDLIRVFWISKSENNAAEYCKSCLSELTKMTRINLEKGRAKLVDRRTGQDMTAAVLPKLGAHITKGKNIEQIANNCGLSKLYDIPFRFESLEVHGNSYFGFLNLNISDAAVVSLPAIISFIRSITLIANNHPQTSTSPDDILRILRIDQIPGA
jgi:hypothetical protein